jgi:hypothetical protein
VADLLHFVREGVDVSHQVSINLERQDLEAALILAQKLVFVLRTDEDVRKLIAIGVLLQKL